MNHTFNELATIRTGAYAQPGPTGEVAYLQARHFGESGDLNLLVPPDLEMDDSIQKHLLRAGDILFAAKGSKNFASVFHGGFSAVASTTFFVATLIGSSVLPEYLVWFLNSPKTLDLLKRQAIGTDIVSISKSVLGKLEVPVPSIDDQKRILEISRLGKVENDLRLKIAELRQRQLQQQITKAIK